MIQKCKKKMSFKSLKTILVFSLFFSWVALFSHCSAAPTAANIPYISKSKIRAILAPGKQAFGEIMVENPTADEKIMHIYLEDWYYLSGGGGAKEFLPAGTLPSSCVSWINFSPADFIVPPFGKQRVSYSLKVPEGQSGAHYAVMFFETKIGNMPSGANTKEHDAGIDLKARIAALFYIEVEGATKRTASVDNLEVVCDSSSKLTISMDFTNTGNADITAVGTFHIMDKGGMVYARGEFNKIYTFPNDKAKLIASWNKPIPRGKYDLVITLDLGKAAQESGLVGKGPVITKEVNLEIGSKGEVIKAQELD